MNHIVLYEPEIPANTGNIMRTCVGTGTKLHLIKPLGFSLEDKYLKRSGVNYIDKLDYEVYENFDDFKSRNIGEYFFLTRYGDKAHTSFNYADTKEDIYLIFGKESTGIPKAILRDYLERCIRIPTTKDVRALNLSNCCALTLYEVLRQQNYPGLWLEEPHKDKNYLKLD